MLRDAGVWPGDEIVLEVGVCVCVCVSITSGWQLPPSHTCLPQQIPAGQDGRPDANPDVDSEGE